MSMQSIPSFSLARQIKNLQPELSNVISDVIESQQFVGGKFVDNLEKKIAAYLQANHVISCNSGTDALWLALRALDMPKDSIVLTTPFSFIASSSEVVALEAHPVFIDIDEETFNVDPKKMNAWLQEHATMHEGQAIHTKTGRKIVGIITVDLFGQPADYVAIKAIADAWKLWIVEDAAQAIGAHIEGKRVGNLGDITAFSFYPTKNLGAFGDGGCCSTNNPVLAERLLQLRNHGRKTQYDYLEVGINSRLDGIQAAILALKLEHLDAWNQRRREIAERYNKGFEGLSWLKPQKTKIGTSVYHQYCVQVIDEAGTVYRNQLEQYLAKEGIGTRIFYPKAFPEIEFLVTAPELVNECPISIKLVTSILALPMWPELTDEEVDHIIQTVKNAPIGAFQEHQKAQTLSPL
jgi:dTDP-4-amino-4,6-dideoxygalactose transaminase